MADVYIRSADSMRPFRALLALVAFVAMGCSAITPTSDTSADQPATSGDSDPTDPTSDPDDAQSTTTTTVDLPDPVWQRLQIELVPITQLNEPVAFTSRSGSLNFFIAERAGRVVAIERTVSEKGKERISSSPKTVLDISEMVGLNGEGGLLGITFSSDGRQLFVFYTDLTGAAIVDEYLVSTSHRADLASRRELLRVEQPASNHNGGGIALGDDGFLYVAFGDGGGSGDAEGNAQNLDTLLGKVIRIDTFPDGDRPYSIPNGNPLVDGGGRPEIWLWGVRNPWKISFDSFAGDLWIADVGQDQVEEINALLARGGGGYAANLGWNQMEGNQPFNDGSAPADHVAPLYTYEHAKDRCSVIGGEVYRGELMPLLNGVYLFGDRCTGEIFGLEIQSAGTVVRRLPVSAAPGQLVSFGAGPGGEIFVMEQSGPDDVGTLYRVEPVETESADG